jgi:vitamin B12 transporter
LPHCCVNDLQITMKIILIFLLILLPIGLFSQNKSTEPSKKESETKTNELQEVTIISLTEEQKEVLKVKNSINPVTIITAKQLENRAGNLNEVLARQAGVQVRSSGGFGSEARISIRGLEGKRVQVFIDGNALNTPDGSFGINDLPVQVIERIEIYKGSVPAYLGGDGLGSAVNVMPTFHANRTIQNRWD